MRGGSCDRERGAGWPRAVRFAGPGCRPPAACQAGPGYGRRMTIAEIVQTAAAESIGRSADACLKCNVCNSVCPVARVTDRFPGPKYVGPQAQRFRLASALSPQLAGLPVPLTPDATVDYCSGCGLCTTACP